MTTEISAEELTRSEVEEARRYLEQARDNLYALTRDLSDGQWKHRPASGGWSIAEVVEHVVEVQERVLGPISHTLAESPESISADARIIDELIKVKFVDRSRKGNAPEFVRPTGRWEPAEALERLTANTARLLERLESTPDLRRHRIPSPPLAFLTDGEYTLMDGYQWILAAAAHTERHTEQITEIKADPGFPAS